MSDERTYRNGILVDPREGYNGWTNYPTWAVKLWIDDEGIYSHWREQAQTFWTDTAYDDETAEVHAERAVDELAAQLKREHSDGTEEALPNPHPSVYDDLMGYALGCVNWYEVAENLISEAAE